MTTVLAVLLALLFASVISLPVFELCTDLYAWWKESDSP